MGYIVDFYCHAAALIIEADGDIHESQRVADRERDDILICKGFKILRFRNQEIEENLNNVLSKILSACQALPNKQDSPPLLGEGLGERSEGVF